MKNLFVAAPLVFSKTLFDGGQVIRAGIGVMAFCLLSGAVYIINDIVDVEKDRAHPLKRRRPIAASRLPVRVAQWGAVGLVTGAMALAFGLGWSFAATAGGYFVLNILYSFWLKRVPFLDVGVIATGFVLRVFAGTRAIDVAPSSWLLVCTALLACFLGFGKRAHELLVAGKEAEKQRAALAGYRLAHLKVALIVSGILTTVAYVLYAVAPHTVAFFGSRRMIVTTPFIAFGVWRFAYLVRRHPEAESPTEEMLRDWPFLANIFLWVVVVMGIIYLAPR